MSLARFATLPWESRFVSALPADPVTERTTRAVRESSYSRVHPTPVAQPHLLAWSEALARQLGISRPPDDERDSIELLSGNRVLPSMQPYAARYGGHQFGNWAGQLGDGRAITLGEAMTAHMGRQEFQLKGAGPTPYSRRADGRAVLRSSIREFLCSEAMHFLGVPTTRALSLMATGDSVVRDMFYDGNPRPEPGAIVCRVSPSFVRFGHFEILASHGETSLLKRLADYLIADQFPELDLAHPDVYGQLLDTIATRTARMISEWMRVGFVHGVMNTDNMSALGLTIDYGPYGWLEPYDPDWTPNTTDAQGRRYRFGHQPAIAFWNLTRLCEAFIPLVKDEARLHEALACYRDTFEPTYARALAQKLGLANLEREEDQKLAGTLFELLQAAQVDFTLFFRSLSDWDPTGPEASARFLKLVGDASYLPLTAGCPSPLDAAQSLAWSQWQPAYQQSLRQAGVDLAMRQKTMKAVNPKYVLRNYLAQNAIRAAEAGDLSLVHRLQRVLERPYDEHPDEADLADKRPEWAKNSPGCSALSCSS